MSECQVGRNKQHKKWLVHHWLGFQLSGVLVLFLLSGVVAVLKAPLTSMLIPSQTQVPSDQPTSWRDLETELAQQYPSMQIYAVTLPKEPYLAAKVTLMQARTSSKERAKSRCFSNVQPAQLLMSNIKQIG